MFLPRNADTVLHVQMHHMRTDRTPGHQRVLAPFLPGMMGVPEDAGTRSQLQKTQNGRRREEGIVLELTPKVAGDEESGKGLKGFQLLVEPERSLPIGARVVDLGGNVTTVLLRNVKTNSGLDQKIFTPSFPTGTDIQDRRNGKENVL